MNYGTWNVRGINTKTTDVIKTITNANMDVIVITETKRKGNGVEEVGDYINIFSGVPKSERAGKGVSIFLRKSYKKTITSYEIINERIATVNMNVLGRKITVIGAYAPTNDDTQTSKDQFFDRLQDEIYKMGNDREIILLGDLNARTGNTTNSKIVGKYGEEVVNDNGERLINLCEANSLKITNGFFKHKNIHKYTWHQDTRQQRSIIDYAIIK